MNKDYFCLFVNRNKHVNITIETYYENMTRVGKNNMHGLSISELQNGIPATIKKMLLDPLRFPEPENWKIKRINNGECETEVTFRYSGSEQIFKFANLQKDERHLRGHPENGILTFSIMISDDLDAFDVELLDIIKFITDSANKLELEMVKRNVEFLLTIEEEIARLIEIRLKTDDFNKKYTDLGKII